MLTTNFNNEAVKHRENNDWLVFRHNENVDINKFVRDISKYFKHSNPAWILIPENANRQSKAKQ